MKNLAAATLCAVLLCACAGATTPDVPTLTNPGGGAPDYCQDTADNVAVAAGAPIPYPADPGNPTAFSPSLPPPVVFAPCLNAASTLTFRQGMACYVCSLDGFYSMAKGAACTQDLTEVLSPPVVIGNAPGFMVCVPAPDGNFGACNPSYWGCS